MSTISESIWDTSYSTYSILIILYRWYLIVSHWAGLSWYQGKIWGKQERPKKCVFLGKKVFSFCSWNTGSLLFARPSSTRSRFFRGHCEGQIRWVLLSFHLPHKGLQVYHGLSRSFVSSSTPSPLLCSSASSPIHHGQLAHQPPLLSQARQLSVGNRRARALLRPCQRECRNIMLSDQ